MRNERGGPGQGQGQDKQRYRDESFSTLNGVWLAKTLSQLLRNVPISDRVGVEINNGNLCAVFDFDLPQIVQIWFPFTVLHQIFGGSFREEDVPSVTDGHYTLSDINSGPRDIRFVI